MVSTCEFFDTNEKGRESYFVLVRADRVCFNSVDVSVGITVHERVKGAGGRWHPEAVAWSLPYERIVSFGLASRMIAGTVPAGFGHQRESAHVDAL